MPLFRVRPLFRATDFERLYPATIDSYATADLLIVKRMLQLTETQQHAPCVRARQQELQLVEGLEGTFTSSFGSA